MFPKKPVVPSAASILLGIARELTAQALEMARDFFMSDPTEYQELGFLDGPFVGAEDVRRFFRSIPNSARVEALRITDGLNLLWEAEKWEEHSGETADKFAVRFARQSMGMEGGLFTTVLTTYFLPPVKFSCYNPWDAADIPEWVTQEAMCAV